MHRRCPAPLTAVVITFTLVLAAGCGGDEPAPTTPDGSRVLAACGGAPRQLNLTAPCGPSGSCTLHRDELVDPAARWRDGAPRLTLDHQGKARVLYRDASDDDPRATFGSAARQAGSSWKSEQLPMDFAAAALSFDDAGTPWLITNSTRGGFERWTRSETQWKRVESAGAFPGWSGAVARDGKGCLHTAAPVAASAAAYGVHVPGSAAAAGKSSWWFSSLGTLERAQLALDEHGTAHVAGWAQDDDGWHIAYVHAGRIERVAGASGEATRGKVFIVIARDERDSAASARPHIVYSSSTSQPWGLTTKTSTTLRLATRGDDGSWSVRDLANTERAAGCNLTPRKSGERCQWTDKRLEPLAVLGGAGLRLVLASLEAEGRDYANCKYLGPGSYGDCTWSRSSYNISETLSLELAWLGADGELVRAPVLDKLSSEHQLAGDSAALRGDARVDADGNIHVVFNDRRPYGNGSRVRYLQLRRN